MKENFNVSKLKNGLTILTFNMPYVNSVAVNLVTKVGSRYENSKKEGISHFLEHMAFKGTKTRTAKQIAEEFDSIGGHFNAYTGHEKTIYYARVLAENCNKTLAIIADIIQNSVFSEEEIAKEYQVILQEIAHTHGRPDDLVYEQFYNNVYKDQPLGKYVAEVHKPIYIKGKKNKVVLILGEDYRNMEETLYLLSIPNMRKSIVEGQEEPIEKCSDKLNW